MKYRKLIRYAAGILAEKLLAVFPLQFLPFPGLVLERFYIHKLKKQEFSSVRDYCLKLSLIPAVPGRLKRISSGYYCKASRDNRPDPAVLDRLSTHYQKKTALGLESLRNKDNAAALNYFGQALEAAGVPPLAKENLSAAFRMVSDSHLNLRDGRQFNAESLTEYHSQKKIILSGMNWSGTGALYDYFREFSCVKALPGEQRLWKESDYSLLWGLNNTEKLNSGWLTEYLLRLFLVPVTGLAVPRNWQDVLGASVGFENIRNDSGGLYSAAAAGFLNKILELNHNKSLDENSFLDCSVEFTDRIFNAVSGNFNGHILPDNSVHLSDIGSFRFFSNANLVCVFRDPRSNYAARFNENVRFNRDPEAFARYYRETREQFSAKKKSLGSVSDRVIEVQFEEFILSEDFRKKLASRLGLDFEGWKKHKFFRPNVSEKNVFNYRQFHDKKTMDYLADELGEFCL